MTTQTNALADALKEKARTSHDESVSKALCAVADVVATLGVETLQGPEGPKGDTGATGAQGPSGAPGTSSEVKQ
jgi:hypothetical protein